MKEGKMFHYVCSSCGSSNLDRVIDFNHFEVECHFCHAKESMDVNNVFVRAHLVADDVRPKRFISQAQRIEQEEYRRLILPACFWLFTDIARKHDMERRYIQVDRMCTLYALREDIAMHLYYAANPDDFVLVSEKIDWLMDSKFHTKSIRHVQKDDVRSEYLLQTKDIFTMYASEKTDDLKYFLLDRENRFAVRLSGWKGIWEEMKDIVHDFELGEHLVDQMDPGY